MTTTYSIHPNTDEATRDAKPYLLAREARDGFEFIEEFATLADARRALAERQLDQILLNGGSYGPGRSSF